MPSTMPPRRLVLSSRNRPRRFVRGRAKRRPRARVAPVVRAEALRHKRNRWFIYVELNFLMQKPSHFHERAFLWVPGYAAFGGLMELLLRYAVASGGYAGADDLSTSWPVARCLFGNLRSGQLVED